MKYLISLSTFGVLFFAGSVGVFAFTTEGHYRWRNDDGSETGATWRNSENTGDTLYSGSNIRLRVELYLPSGSSATSGSLSLYYSTDGTSFTQITRDSSANAWVLSRSTNFSDGDSTTTQLTDNDPFVGGVMIDSSDTVSYTLPSSGGSDEYEFCIAPTTHAVSGTLYYFRMQDPVNGSFTSPFGSGYDTTPSLLYLNGTGVITKSATNITFNSAVANGSVYPDSTSTTVYIIYGNSPGIYTDSVEAVQSPVTGGTPTLVSADLTGLSAATTYYYRVSAKNSKGYVRGAEEEFASSYYTAGKALKFNYTSSDYVRTPLATSAANNYTIECWVKWNGPTGANQALFYNGLVAINGYGVILDNSNSDKVSYYVGVFPSSSTINSDSTLPTNRWTHVALTSDASNNWIIYINGDSIAGGNYGATQPGGNFFIGGDGSDFFNGSIDEVRFFNTALDSTQIRSDMHRTIDAAQNMLSLNGYWQFNEGSGSTAHDLGAFQNDGTLSGFAFNGSDGWVTSTAPLGYGTSADTAGFTSGTADLGTVSLTTTDAFDNPVQLVGTEITAAPDSLPTSSAALLSDRYWIITPFGTPGTFSTNLTFTVPSTFTAHGTESGSTYTLYHRGDNDDGSWSAIVTGAASVTDTTITFDGITSFSQFMIGSSDVSLAVQATDFVASSGVNSVTLSWKTQSEVENAGFNILREEAGTGSFKLISSYTSDDSLRGLGTSSTGRSYEFTDNHVVSGETYQYKIQSVSTNGGTTKDLSTLSVTVDVPKTYALYQNYPNPFNPTTTIGYELSAKSQVSLKIYDVLGREVATLVDGQQNAGVYKVDFNASRFASGVYFYRLTAAGNNGKTFSSVKKLVLVK